MKIFGKRINDFISLVFGGKPVTIKPENPEEMEKTLDLVRKASAGDQDAEKQLSDQINKPIEDVLPEMAPELKQIKQEVAEQEVQYQNAKSESESQSLEVLENHPDFEVIENSGVKKYYLKGFKSDLPDVIVKKFAQLVYAGQDFSHLVKFWQMNLLNSNAEARRGLYKYITKQKLIVAEEGYFVTFRRVVTRSKGAVVRNSSEKWTTKQLVQIEDFAAKVKRWKRGRRSYEIYKNGEELILSEIKNHEKNNDQYTFLGTLYDVLESLKISDSDATDETVTKEAIYTDARTKTMVIRIGQPVRQDRSKCNENSKENCSYGLHVGTPTYVGKCSGLGDTIVACLVNPMHVISVPYSDAHKMRVCEYLPFKILTKEELAKFDEINISKYEQSYKEIEHARLVKALEVIDELSPKEIGLYSSGAVVKSKEELEEMQKSIDDKKSKVKDHTISLNHLLDDKISSSLDLEEIRKIIKSRLK